ncbi:hypothetical protein HF086_001647 [Spodoptera exigua]|uniref:Uncharacterized protein n=1 Tax=Spodoptera exigua TaxID=7107 RepID=A0A922SJQ4_SPOEX|nr:hypothetical protein HF086_001647 [Spodoptera exigua]
MEGFNLLITTSIFLWKHSSVQQSSEESKEATPRVPDLIQSLRQLGGYSQRYGPDDVQISDQPSLHVTVPQLLVAEPPVTDT